MESMKMETCNMGLRQWQSTTERFGATDACGAQSDQFELQSLGGAFANFDDGVDSQFKQVRESITAFIKINYNMYNIRV